MRESNSGAISNAEAGAISMKQHLSDTVLALYASGDLDWRDRIGAAWHVRTCERCAKTAQAFREDVAFRKQAAEAMPLPANWDQLAEEMAANIRLGLAASECIRDIEPRVTLKPVGATRPNWFWKPAAGIAGAMAVVLVAWYSFLPPEASRAVSRVWDAAVNGRTGIQIESPSLILESSASGVELRKGSRTSVKLLVVGREPDQFSANLDGSMRAQYVDDVSGQITVTNVYAE